MTPATWPYTAASGVGAEALDKKPTDHNPLLRARRDQRGLDERVAARTLTNKLGLPTAVQCRLRADPTPAGGTEPPALQAGGYLFITEMKINADEVKGAG